MVILTVVTLPAIVVVVIVSILVSTVAVPSLITVR